MAKVVTKTDILVAKEKILVAFLIGDHISHNFEPFLSLH